MKTIFYKLFVSIFITLSLFSVVNADEHIDSSYLKIVGQNHVDVTNDDNIEVDQSKENGGTTEVFAKYCNSIFYIQPTQSGLYAISCYTIDSYTSRNELSPKAYQITDNSNENGSLNNKGKFLCIPAHYNSTADTYTLYSQPISPNKGNTTTAVYLMAGQTYVLYFTGGGSAKATIRYLPEGETYNGVKVEYNNIYISGFSTEDRTLGKSEKSQNSTARSTTQENIVDKPVIPLGSTKKIRTPDDKLATSLVKSENMFEISIVSLMLSIGDFFVQLLNKIVGETVTITRLIFNQVKAVNINFFDQSARASSFGGLAVGESINKWFQFFRGFAIVFYLIALLGIGINTLLNSTAKGMDKARQFMSQWIKGVIILFLIPIVMKYTFRMNEALVKMVQDANGFDDSSTMAGVLQTGSSFSDANTWSDTEIEFRSPEYISKYTGRVTFGTVDATVQHLKKLNDYKQNLDLMNIMRAYAGYSCKLGYTIIWYVLIGQLIVFLFIYYKRYFIIAFLVAVFPVTCIYNAISIIQGKPGPQMSTWFKEFFSNVFTQFFHAVVYSVITGIIVNIVRDSLTGRNNVTAGATNWIIIIVAINFVPEGERIIKKMISSLGGGKTDPSLGKSGGGLRGAAQRGLGNIKQMAGIFRGK